MKYEWSNPPITPGHMWKRIFSYREHLKNIGMEGFLDHVQVNISKVLANGLLGCIVDEDVDFPEAITVSNQKPHYI